MLWAISWLVPRLQCPINAVPMRSEFRQVASACCFMASTSKANHEPHPGVDLQPQASNPPLGVCYERGGRFVEIWGPRKHPFPKKDPLDFCRSSQGLFLNQIILATQSCGYWNVWNTLQPRFCVVPRPQNTACRTLFFKIPCNPCARVVGSI